MKTNENVKAITEELEQGVMNLFESEAYKEYLEFMGKFYNYSSNNIILILSQRPDAKLVAGFKAWHTKFGRKVKQGAKAIKILAPIQRKYTRMVADDNGDEVEKEYAYMAYRIVNVFDVSDTEGDPLPSLGVHELTENVEEYADVVYRLTGIAPVPIVYEDISTGAKGYYSHDKNCIVVKTGMGQSQTIKTLVHEIAHSMLHCKGGEESEADRYTREVQAESVAYTVCSYLGLDTSEYSFGYIAGWSSGKELKELQKSMEVIRRAAQTIIKGLEASTEEVAA